MCLSPSLRIRIFPNAFNSLVHSLPSPMSCCAPTVQNLSSILKSLFSSSTFLKFSTFFIDSLGILPHAPQFHSPPRVPSPMQHHLKEILKNKKKIRQESSSFLHLSQLSDTSSFILVASGATVCHAVHPLSN